MKARVNQTGILLSVGMIVKNEEQHLPNCLEALQPLLEAIPSELIIVDTGSTDTTREIAAQYTDKVYDFEWIDDFAAARNETLKHATGAWYMYLDADEWVTDCSEIISFFQDEDALTHYNSATFVLRNYLDMQKIRKMDTNLTRIMRRYPGNWFQSKIHEYLKHYKPEKALSTVVEHFGYTRDDEKYKKKQGRNLPMLLLQLEDCSDAEKPHIYEHLAREYGTREEWDKVAEASRKGIAFLCSEMAAERCALYHDLTMALSFSEDWDDLLKEADEYFAGKKIEYATDIDIHLFKAEAYLTKKDEENAINEMEICFSLISKMESGQLDSSDLSTAMLLFSQEGRLNGVYLSYADLLRKRDPAKAVKALEKLDGLKGVKRTLAIQIGGECVEASRDWGWYARYYDRIQADESWRGLWKQRIIRTLEDFPESREPMGQAFANIGGPDDPFVLLVRQYSDPEAKLQLENLLPVIPADIEAMLPLYCAMREELDIEPLITRFDWDDMSDAAQIIGHYGDAGEVIDRYFQVYPNPPSLRGKRWKCVLQEHILLGTPPECDAGRRAFQSYCESLRNITSALYGNPDEENLSIIPHGHRFGVFMDRAEKAHERGDIAEYVRLLKKAAEAYPIMAKPVKLRIDEIGRLVEEEHRKQEERELLYSQIKDKILALIRIGDLTNAAQILGQYEKINPKDEEVAFLYRQIQNPEQPS